MPSRAFQLFNGKKKREVLRIACVFEDVNSGRGPNTNYGLLNGALVLLISSWEVYCEGVCQEAAIRILKRQTIKFAQLNRCLQCDLIRYAGDQYDGKNPLDQKLAMLPDGGWRQLLVGRLNEYIKEFNTPKFYRDQGKNLNRLFRQTLGLRKMSTEIENLLEDSGFCARLDQVVTLRGKIAHTGTTPANDRLSPDILRQHTDSFIEAAAAVDVIVYQEFLTRFGFTPWQMTEPMRQALRQVAQDKL